MKEKNNLAKKSGGTAILVVDDRQDLRRMYQNFYKTMGCFVEAAVSGEAALALCQGMRFDLVLTDQQMGEGMMTGIQLAAKLAEMEPSPIVVLASGYGISEKEAGPAVARILKKPVELQQLRDLLDLIPGRPKRRH